MGRPRKIVRRSADACTNAASSGAPTAEAAIERLPDELLLALMSLLTVTEVAPFARVCRRFAALSRDESLWCMYVGRLTCRAPSQVSKPPTRSWREHYRRLSVPPTFTAVCHELPQEQQSYAIVGDCLYVAMRDEIVQYRAPAEPGPIDEGAVVGRLLPGDDQQWTDLRTVGRLLLAEKSSLTTGATTAVVLLDCCLTPLQSILPIRCGANCCETPLCCWLLLGGRVLAVTAVGSGAVLTAAEGSRGVPDQEIGRLPFALASHNEDFEFVATGHSFGVFLNKTYTEDEIGLTRVRLFGNRHEGALKFFEIGTAMSDSGARLAVVDQVVVPLPIADARRTTVQLASIDDAYLVLSVADARLDVFAVRTRRTTASLPLLSWTEGYDCRLQCAPAPAIGLLYVSLRLGHALAQPTLLFALNSSGACLWRTELPRREGLWFAGLRALRCYPLAVFDSRSSTKPYGRDIVTLVGPG